MAQDINSVILIGRLTADMELGYTVAGGAIGKFTIAVNRSRKDASGQWVQEGSFFECKLYGKMSESLKPFLKKGVQVCVDGYLKRERWQDQQTGQNRSKIIIGINQIELLGGKKEENGGYNNSGYDNGYDGGYNDGYGYN